MADEPCFICFGEEGQPDVYFSPCAHKACEACVQKLRIANVYKADKGVSCPCCRQPIDAFLQSPPRAHQPVNTYGRHGISSLGNGNDYLLPRVSVGGGDLKFRFFKHEDMPAGYILPTFRDDFDVISMARDRAGSRHLDFMLREEYPKSQKVAKMCRDFLLPTIGELATHPYGNFVFQRLLEYAAHHRDDGLYTAIVKAVCRDGSFVTAAQEKHGTFCMQRLSVLMRGAEELREVSKAIRGRSLMTLCLHPQGVYVIERLVEGLITTLKSGSSENARFPKTDAVNVLVQLATDATSNASCILSLCDTQAGVIIVECIRWSLPSDGALKAAMAIAAQTRACFGSRNAYRALQGLLSLELKEVADTIITSLEGNLCRYCLDLVNSGWKLVKACFATRCVDEETRMYMLNELLDSDYIESQYGYTFLAFGLTVLSDKRNVNDYLQAVHSKYGFNKYKKLSGAADRIEQGVPSYAKPSTRGLENTADPWLSSEDEAGVVMKSNGSSPDMSQASIENWENLATSFSQECATSTTGTGAQAINNVASRPVTPQYEVFPQHAVWEQASSTLLQSSPESSTVPPALAARPSEAAGPSYESSSSQEVHHFEASLLGDPRPAGILSLQQPTSLTFLKTQDAGVDAAGRCMVCSSGLVTTVLLDCAHMCCCGVCAYLLSSCPVCKQAVRQVVEVKSAALLSSSDSGGGNTKLHAVRRPYRPPDIFPDN